MSGDRELDVVVFGATGFVGRLVAGYLAGHAPGGVRIGLAGRSERRLAGIRAGLGGAAMPGELAKEWRQAAATLIEAAIPDDTELPRTWPVCAALLPHARAVLDLTSSGMFRIAQYLGRSGNYPPPARPRPPAAGSRRPSGTGR